MSMHPLRNYFADYKKDCTVFVETGTYRAEGMVLAQKAGFTDIHSIDIVERTDLVPHIGKRYIGDSRVLLPQVIEPLTDRMMFWLDGHSMLLEGEPDNFPLLEELAIIAAHPRKDHVILIDDMHMMTHPDVTGWSDLKVLSTLLNINPDYMVTRLANPIRNDILVAYV